MRFVPDIFLKFLSNFTNGQRLLSFQNTKHRESVISEMSGDGHDRTEIGQFSPTRNAT